MVNPYAKALINVGVHPRQSAAEAQAAVMDHPRMVTPFGFSLTVEPSDTGDGFETTTSGVAYEAARGALRTAWRREPIEIGSGGAIPLLRRCTR